MDALDKDIRDNGCHQCGEELIERRTVHDEGLEKDFCDVECQLAFYQEEYNRLITKNNRLSRDRSMAMLELSEANNALSKRNDRLAEKNERMTINRNMVALQLKNARAEIRTIWDSARVAMVQTGQGIVE